MLNAINFNGTDFSLDSDEIEANLLEALIDCGQSGDVLPQVQYVIANWSITGDTDDCRKYLAGYGAWVDDELLDHTTNLERLVWLTGSALLEDESAYFSTY